MNACMNIRHDADVIDCLAASEKDCIDFENGKRLKPLLKPMQIDWRAGRESRWNQSLFMDFLPFFRRAIEAESALNMASDDVIETMFYDRLERLRRIVKKGTPRNGETADDVVRRMALDKVSVLRLTRRNTRQQSVRKVPLSKCQI
jgi:hypothetical protein